VNGRVADQEDVGVAQKGLRAAGDGVDGDGDGIVAAENARGRLDTGGQGQRETRPLRVDGETLGLKRGAVDERPRVRSSCSRYTCRPGRRP